MSAFICSDRHTVSVAAWAAARKLVDDPINAAISLRAVNNHAIRCRYGDEATPLCGIANHLKHAEHELRNMPSANYADRWAFSLLRCLDYQCSEGDAKETNPAAPLLARLLDAADKLTSGQHIDSLWAID